MDLRTAKKLLMEVGGITFGAPDIAREALEEVESFIGDGEDPIHVVWGTFMELLDAYDQLATAFEHAWPRDGVIAYCRSVGMTMQDAEDISQKVAAIAWRQIYRYKPWLASWNTWILAITKNQIAKFFRDTKKDRENVEIDQVLDGTKIVIIDRQGWSIPTICREWIESGIRSRVKFAAAMLLIYNNWDWFEPTSREMVALTGLSKSTCFRLFGQFVMEVMDREGKG